MTGTMPRQHPGITSFYYVGPLSGAHDEDPAVVDGAVTRPAGHGVRSPTD